MFNLGFANNTILSCFFFLIIDTYFLIPAVVMTKTFIAVGEIEIPIGIPTSKAKAKMETLQ